MDIKRSILKVKKNIIAAAEADKAYANFKKQKDKSNSQPQKFYEYAGLSIDIKKLIFENFSFYEKLYLRLVSKKFRDIINQSWIIDGAIPFFIGNKQLVKFIEQPVNINDKNAIKVIDILNELRRVKPRARKKVIEFVENKIAEDYQSEEDKCKCWNEKALVLKAVIVVFGALAILFFMGGLLGASVLNKEHHGDKNLFYFIPSAVFAILTFCAVLNPRLTSSAYANLRYGRFFSSEPVVQDEENQLSKAAPERQFVLEKPVPVVEVYPKVVVDVPENPIRQTVFTPTIVDGDKFYDAKDDFSMRRTDPAVLQLG